MTDGNFNLFYKVTSIKILRTFNLEINRINKTVDKNKNKNTQLCHFEHIPVFQLNHIFNHFQELYTNFQPSVLLFSRHALIFFSLQQYCFINCGKICLSEQYSL